MSCGVWKYLFLLSARSGSLCRLDRAMAASGEPRSPSRPVEVPQQRYLRQVVECLPVDMQDERRHRGVLRLAHREHSVLPRARKTSIWQAGPAVWNKSSDALAVVTGDLPAMCPLGPGVAYRPRRVVRRHPLLHVGGCLSPADDTRKHPIRRGSGLSRLA